MPQEGSSQGSSREIDKGPSKPNHEEKAPPMDIKGFLEQMDNDKNVFKEIMDIFFEIVPTRISNIREALAEKNTDTVFKEAHAIKGEGGNIFAQDLSQAAHALEQIGRSGDLTEGGKYLYLIEQEFKRVKEYYDNYEAS